MNFFQKLVFFVGLFISLSGYSIGICEVTGRPLSDRSPQAGKEGPSKSKGNLGAWLTSVYGKTISRVDSDRCPSIPSCAAYSGMAFKKHGFFIGWVMTVDRLIHEADERSVSPVVYHRDRLKVLDPVKNNDFWWYCRDDPKQK